jgi:hypothetical protein
MNCYWLWMNMTGRWSRCPGVWCMGPAFGIGWRIFGLQMPRASCFAYSARLRKILNPGYWEAVSGGPLGARGGIS